MKWHICFVLSSLILLLAKSHLQHGGTTIEHQKLSLRTNPFKTSVAIILKPTSLVNFTCSIRALLTGAMVFTTSTLYVLYCLFVCLYVGGFFSHPDHGTLSQVSMHPTIESIRPNSNLQKIQLKRQSQFLPISGVCNNSTAFLYPNQLTGYLPRFIGLNLM